MKTLLKENQEKKAKQLIDIMGIYSKDCVREILDSINNIEGQSPNIYDELNFWEGVQDELNKIF